MNETYEQDDKRELPVNMSYQLVTVFTLATCFSPYIYFQSPLSEEREAQPRTTSAPWMSWQYRARRVVFVIHPLVIGHSVLSDS